MIALREAEGTGGKPAGPGAAPARHDEFTVCPSADDITSLSHSFLICKIKIIIVLTHRAIVQIKQEIHEKYSEQCLA